MPVYKQGDKVTYHYEDAVAEGVILGEDENGLLIVAVLDEGFPADPIIERWELVRTSDFYLSRRGEG